MADDDVVTRGDPPTDRVAFDYVKSEQFRVIRADGAIGSVTPHGHIHVVFFSERPAIPRRMVYSVSRQGELGAEIRSERLSRNSVVREMDVDLFVNIETAESIHAWLGDKIKQAKAQTRTTRKKKRDGGSGV